MESKERPLTVDSHEEKSRTLILSHIHTHTQSPHTTHKQEMKAISSIKPMGGGLKPPVAIPPPAATLDDIPANIFDGEEELEGRHNKNAKRKYF